MSDPPASAVSPGVMAAAQILSVDAVTAAVAGAFAEAGVRGILLKGPTTARRLYWPRDVRPYCDTDLLVAPGSLPMAETVLGDLGFAPRFSSDTDAKMQLASHARTWIRADDDAKVDMHKTLVGVGVSPARAWAVLSRDTDRLRVGKVDVEVLGTPASALHLALHAAQHGVRENQPLEDLRRAVGHFDHEVWANTAVLAERLDAVSALGLGLRLLAEGAVVADRLDLPTAGAVELVLLARSAPGRAITLERLVTAPGARKTLALVWAKLVPPPDFVSYWSPFTRAGRFGKALAYVWRPAWVIMRVPTAIYAWWSARRHVRRDKSPPSRPCGE